MGRPMLEKIIGRAMTDEEKLIAGIVMTFAFMLLEGWFAIVAGSLAMLGDAAHMLSDAAAFAVSLAALKIARRGPTMRHTYGLARLEVVGALASTLALWAVTAGLVIEAVRRIKAYFAGDAEPVDGKLMVILGCFGVTTNICMERILGAHSHGIGGGKCEHEHDHGGHHDEEAGHGGHGDHGHGGHHNPLHGDALGAHRGGDHKAHGHEAHGHAAEAHGHDAGHDGCCGGDHGSNGDHASGHDHEAHGHKPHGHAEKAHDHDAPAHKPHASEEHGHDAGHAHSAHAHEEAKDDHGGHDHAKTPLGSKRGYSAIATDHGPPKTAKRSLNIDAAYLHVLGDLLQNLGVILAGAVIWAKPTWQVADPLVTLFFAGIVVKTTFGFVGQTVNILLEGAPANVDVTGLRTALRDVDGVGDVHDIHVWELTADKPVMSCHVLLKEGALLDEVLMRCQDVCADGFEIDHATIQVQSGRCRARTCCAEPTQGRPREDSLC